MRRNLFLIITLLTGFAVHAQQLADTVLYSNHDDVVVTGTRTERKLGNEAIPVQVIGQKQISQNGSLRLNDILQEQTGIFLTGGTGSGAVGGGVFGNGIQLQGLSADYTLILLDGEPLVGRQGGVMDLSRFTVGNIRKIEIVKGPSSSLYGSEAMGGVVNIITQNTRGSLFKTGLRYGSFQTADVFAEGAANSNGTGLYYFLNRNSGRGYDLDKTTAEKTLDPYYNYTAQLKFTRQLAARTELAVNSRYYYGNQESYYAINSNTINIGGTGVTSELNLNPVLTHRFSSRLKNTLRITGNHYRFTQGLDSLANKQPFYNDDFAQGFYRVENQADYEITPVQTLSAGAGYTLHTVQTNRYREDKLQRAAHAFAQHQWQPFSKLSVISGLRYDYNSDYSGRISPKLAVQYQLVPGLNLHASYGAGFKAPDFRQLYLHFVNNAGNGYSIYGAAEFSLAELQRRQAAGFIADILPAASQITKLKPETSNGINVGARWQACKSVAVDMNLFRNDISNLIIFVPVATHNNGAQIFSYMNVNRAFTQGGEVNILYRISKNIQATAGYQYLETADKDILKAVKNGKVYGRDYEGGPARIMQRKDYTGLLTRSRHMLNMRLAYDNAKTGWMATLRLIYRSKWGVQDRDANGFANFSNEFAPGMLQANASIGKKIGRLSLQAGVNNLLNQTNARYAPNMPGINWFSAVQYQFKKNKQ